MNKNCDSEAHSNELKDQVPKSKSHLPIIFYQKNKKNKTIVEQVTINPILIQAIVTVKGTNMLRFQDRNTIKKYANAHFKVEF